jgi:hypothetical protein
MSSKSEHLFRYEYRMFAMARIPKPCVCYQPCSQPHPSLTLHRRLLTALCIAYIGQIRTLNTYLAAFVLKFIFLITSSNRSFTIIIV